MTKITIYLPPNDYRHPAIDPVYNIGDRVIDLLYGYGPGTITEITNGYYNRADEWVERRGYIVAWDDWGVASRFGYQLNPFQRGDQ